MVEDADVIVSEEVGSDVCFDNSAVVAFGCLDRAIYKLLYVIIDNVFIANLSIIVLGLIHFNIVITILRFVVSGEKNDLSFLVETGGNHSIGDHLWVHDWVIAAYVNVKDVAVGHLLDVDRATNRLIKRLGVSSSNHTFVCGLNKDRECTLVISTWRQIYIGCLEYRCRHSRLSQTTSHDSKESLTLIGVHVAERYPDVGVSFCFKGSVRGGVYPRQPGGLACNGSRYLIKSVR